MSAIPSRGNAWQSLEQAIGPVVDELMTLNSIPGLTLAVTRDGKLLLEKGYGRVRIDGGRELPAGPNSRFKIGSVSKACITGPAGFQAMAARQLNPATTRLYGPGGIFGGSFDDDIEIRLQVFAGQPGVQAARRSWYRSITIQHLLDHDAGFANSGSAAAAAVLFGIPEHEVTYEHVHSHFLRTKLLLYQPGTAAQWEAADPDNRNPYSNHGFGLWTLLIPTITGRTFPEYVRDEHLAPLNLQHDVRPERQYPDSCDAGRYTVDGDGALQLVPFKDSGPELAAGGFMASARALLGITRHLAATYTGEDLDRMGWGRNSKGKLAHNGAAGGLRAYVAMFPDGYISNSGVDLSRIHVAAAVNTGTITTGQLRELTDACALSVPPSQVPDDFDLWDEPNGARCEYLPLPAGVYSIRQKSSRRLVDAHEHAGADFSVVTRSAQNNDTQRWRFTPVGAVYTIQQVSSDRFVDAHESADADFSVVSRGDQGNDSQRWVAMNVVGDRSTYTLQQLSSGRFLDAHEHSGQDFSLVTRPAQNNDTQRWVLAPQADGTLTVVQSSSGRFMDAHEHAGEDFSLVTRASQDNDTQRWRFTLVGAVYTIQQVSSDRFVDAHEHSGQDFSLVTRPGQQNDSQRWVHLGGTLQQLSSARFMDAHEHDRQDFSVVTRAAQPNDTQRWFIE